MSDAGVRRRLTGFYAAATFGLLLAALLVMRHVARRALLHEHEAAGLRSAALVRSFFRAELAEYRQVDVTISHLAGELVFAGMIIEFLRPDGSRFAIARQPLATAQPRPPVVMRTQALEERLAPGWRLRLTVSVADLDAALRGIDRLTLWSVVFAVVLATLVAWWMTGRALAPVAAMANAADRLDDPSGARLPVANPTDEFGRLGGSFNRLLDRLDRALRDQQRFLADAAHELRTPVARLLGASEAQLARPDATNARETLAEITTELRNTSGLIDELLYLARSDAGAVATAREKTFLDDLVSDAVARATRAAEARHQMIDASDLTETPLTGDPHQLVRLATVLIENAIRYAPDGGSIRVSTRLSEGEAVLVVEDSGPGVPSSEREDIFGRFVRGKQARTLAPEGSGLGLAIARTIVEAHRGTLTVDDSPLGGARFTARIPA